MGIPVIFISVILFTVWVQIKLRKSGKENQQDFGNFLEEEMKSNSVRKKEIPKELFCVPDITALPIKEYANDSAYKKIINKQNAAIQSAKRPMLKFGKPMTNREIKYAFGTANLDVVTGYEDNYEHYVDALLRWAEALLEMDCTEDATKVLKESITIGSDYSKSYTLLADIYFAQEDKDNLRDLYNLLEMKTTLTYNLPIKYKMLTYIEKLLDTPKTDDQQ